MARLLGRLIFFALILLVAVILLILLKARWPDLDIYGPLPWPSRDLSTALWTGVKKCGEGVESSRHMGHP